jgi:fatty acid desaturase
MRDNSSLDDISLSDLRKCIPAHLFTPTPMKSLLYSAWDVGVVALLLRLIVLLEAHPAWWWWGLPFYALAQGTMFWAIFVLGHDCGHGSFSNSAAINSFVGHLLHSFLLVPYHSWRISHMRGHHKNTGNMDKDEIFYPFRAARMQKKKWRLGLYAWLPCLVPLAWPLYLLLGYEMKGWRYSHFNPRSSLFRAEDQPLVRFSIGVWTAAGATLTCFGMHYGWTRLLAYYTAPYFVFSTYLVIITFLHHYNDEEGVTWYSNTSWSYVKGNLSTVDRNYGILERIHHNIGTHSVHHLFPQIPHYNLVHANVFLQQSPVASATHTAKVTDHHRRTAVCDCR